MTHVVLHAPRRVMIAMKLCLHVRALLQTHIVVLICRRVDLQPTEILTKVFLPYTQKLEYVKEFKQAHRRDDDIAIANAGMRVQFKQTAEGDFDTNAFCMNASQ